MPILYLLSTILYMLKEKSEKKTALSRLKIKATFFIYTPDHQSKNFFNELIASDLLTL